MRSASVSLAACSCLLFLVACGGDSQGAALPENYARLAADQAERIALALESRRPCVASRAAALLQRSTIRAINDRLIPEGLQEELLSRVNGLAGLIECSGPPDGSPARVARALANWLRARSG